MFIEVELAEVQLEPFDCGVAGLLEHRQVRIEMSALDGHEALGLQRAFVGGQLQVGQRDGVAGGHNHQERGRRFSGVAAQWWPERKVLSRGLIPTVRMLIRPQA